MKKVIGVILLILTLVLSGALYQYARIYQDSLAHEPMTASDLGIVIENGGEAEAEPEAQEETEEEKTEEETPAETEQEQEPLPASRAQDLADLQKQLEEKISSYGGTWAVYVKYLPTEEEISIGNQSLVAASLIKLFIAGAYLEDLESEKVPDTYRDAMVRMLSLSDNAAANSLIDLLGMDRINEFIKAHDFPDTLLNRKMLANNGLENYTSVKDCGMVMDQIYHGTYVSESASQLILGALKNQKVTTKIPAGLPEGTECANKTGELSRVENDAAIVFVPDQDYIFCVMSNNVSAGNAQTDIREMSGLIYEVLQKES